MAFSHPSPGVYTREIDLSQRIAVGELSVGLIVGRAKQGPVGQRTLVSGETELINKFGTPDASLDFALHSAVQFFNAGELLYFTRIAPMSLYAGIDVTFDGAYNGNSVWQYGVLDPTDVMQNANCLFSLIAKNQGEWANNLRLVVYPDTSTPDAYFYVDVYQVGSSILLERHHCTLYMNTDGFGNQTQVEYVINTNSSVLNVIMNPSFDYGLKGERFKYINTFDSGANTGASQGMPLIGGDNGEAPDQDDYIQALDLYEDKEEVNVNIFINAGNRSIDFMKRAVSLCEERADCFAILDVPPEYQRYDQAIQFRRNVLASDSNYAGLYSSDILVTDDYNGIRLYLPPSGFVASAFVFTDKNYATWFAPAGPKRGKLTRAAGVRQVYNQGMRDALYQSQINVISVLPDVGITIMGADTLQVKASSLSNISVRRLLMMIETSLEKALAYSLFDPNNETLRSFIEQTCEAFLQPIQDADGLYGFKVVCDSTNNTPATIANGDLIVDIYLDAVIPIKRILLNVSVTRTGGISVSASV